MAPVVCFRRLVVVTFGKAEVRKRFRNPGQFFAVNSSGSLAILAAILRASSRKMREVGMMHWGFSGGE